MTRSTPKRAFVGAALVALIALAAPAEPAFAEDINVTEDADENNTDTDCSLREALLSAGNDSSVDACEAGSGADVVNLQATTYFLSTGPLVVSDNEATFNGAGQGSTIIDANDTSRVLQVSGPDDPVVLDDLTIRDGLSAAGGGGIQNFGVLTLQGVLVTSNEISGGLGGGINSTSSATLNVQGSSIDSNVGRGIHNEGELTITDSSVSNNTDSTSTTPDEGGIQTVGPNADTMIDGSTISDNSGSGILNQTALTVTDTMITDNHAGTGGFGGGVSIGANSAVSAATTALDDVTISGNDALDGGGGGIANGSNVPGGITNLTVTDSTIHDNEADSGGGIENFADAGTTTIARTTISANSATGTPSLGFGGGISNGAGSSGAVMALTNTTISGNDATCCGGGIQNFSGVVALAYSTVSGNVSTGPGAGGIQTGGTLNIGATILANSTGADCSGTLSSQGYNLIESATAPCVLSGDATGNITGSDPVLGALAPNGGPTLTHALLAGSPAINAGSPSCPPPATDQRGIVRQPGRTCDIGAFEIEEPPVPSPPPGSGDTDTSAPDTAITKGPKDKTKKKTATFEFSGTDARALAGFECSLDGGAFAACASPFTMRVKKGKHTFSVRAIDAAGNVDASAATDDWRVKKKKKR